MSGRKKKTNPNKRPVTEADVRRAKDEATNEAIRRTTAIFLTVLVDKCGFDEDGIIDFWHKVEDLSDSIVKRRVNVSDLACVLREEYGIWI